MQSETARKCMSDIGLSREKTECVISLMKSNRKDEARQRLRRFRCELMDEVHACQRKVDQLDWLIRETEKQTND